MREMFGTRTAQSTRLQRNEPWEQRETALESLRRYNVYRQLLECYQFFHCHPNMAAVFLGAGVCLQLTAALYYACYYLNLLVNIYSTVLPNIMTLLNFSRVDMQQFKPPRGMGLMTYLNMVTCYLGLICTVICFYLMLPIKGRYLATVRKQLERRRFYCIVLSAILFGSLIYQICLSLLNYTYYLKTRNDHSSLNLLLLPEEHLTKRMLNQLSGNSSFWTLHALHNVPCCLSPHFNTSVLPNSNMPAECCVSFGINKNATLACQKQIRTEKLWPHCSAIVLNLIGDIEVTTDAQMQLFLLITCVITFVVKFSLHPHLRMRCLKCQPTYGWLGMKRKDN